LAPLLPKAPTLKRFNFLQAKKGGSLIKEAFEDNWSAAALSYAAAVQTTVEVEKLVTDGTIDGNSALVKSSERSLITAQNVLARSIQKYKDVATRQATNSTASNASGIFSTEDIKELQASIDAAARLKKTVHKPVWSNAGNNNGSWRNRNRYNAGSRNYRSQRGRGRGYGRGRGRGRYRSSGRGNNSQE
jgi:hypothetical protein